MRWWGWSANLAVRLLGDMFTFIRTLNKRWVFSVCKKKYQKCCFLMKRNCVWDLISDIIDVLPASDWNPSLSKNVQQWSTQHSNLFSQTWSSFSQFNIVVTCKCSVGAVWSIWWSPGSVKVYENWAVCNKCVIRKVWRRRLQMRRGEVEMTQDCKHSEKKLHSARLEMADEGR